HTRSKRDWSSDVCSSDLEIGMAISPYSALLHRPQQPLHNLIRRDLFAFGMEVRHHAMAQDELRHGFDVCRRGREIASDRGFRFQIGRASCRERVEVAGGV